MHLLKRGSINLYKASETLFILLSDVSPSIREIARETIKTIHERLSNILEMDLMKKIMNGFRHLINLDEDYVQIVHQTGFYHEIYEMLNNSKKIGFLNALIEFFSNTVY